MLNEELLDEKDKMIIRLKSQIHRYKMYDQKRMKYVRELEGKYNEMLSYLKEEGIDDLVKKNKELKVQITSLNKKLLALKNYDIVERLQDDQLKLIATLACYREQIKLKDEKLKKNKQVINDLLYRVNH